MSRPKIAVPLPDPPDDDSDLDADEQVQAAIDFELEHRRWLRSLLPVIWDDRPPASSDAVEFGRNLVRLAACERACRILRSDLPEEKRLGEQADQHRAIAAEAPARQ
jgi:hypothetical protein